MAQAGGNPNDVSVRIDRIENALRQLTGSVEELQHQNQMLQMQLKRMQDDTEYRFQQLGAQRRRRRRRWRRADDAPANAPAAERRARAALRRLQSGSASQCAGRAARARQSAGDRRARAAWQHGRERPADRRARRGRPPARRSICRRSPATGRRRHGSRPAPASPMPRPWGSRSRADGAAAGCAAARRAVAAAAAAQHRARPACKLATLPPSASPKDEYQLAYGYVLHKDYGLAEQAFRDFLRKYPHEKLLPDAQYWLGESLFQQKRYRDAAESFLAVSTKYEHSGKAPEALLRLGQSLVGTASEGSGLRHAWPKSGANIRAPPARVKRGVAREQKRTHC